MLSTFSLPFEEVRVGVELMLAWPPGRRALHAKSRPRITLAIPSFNSEKTIARCLGSAVAQSGDDIEIIVVDNASTDTTASLALGTAAQDPRVIVYKSLTNVGRVPNWNRCLAVASGTYVKVLMTNDFLLPSAAAALGDALDRNPQAIIARGSLAMMEQAGATLYPLFPESCCISAEDALRWCVTKGNIGGGPSSQMYRRDEVLSLGLSFDETLSYGADFALVVRAVGVGGIVYERGPHYVFDQYADRFYRTASDRLRIFDEFAGRLLAAALLNADGGSAAASADVLLLRSEFERRVARIGCERPEMDRMWGELRARFGPQAAATSIEREDAGE